MDKKRIEEAINILDNMSNSIKESSEIGQALEAALVSLEKQMPKKVDEEYCCPTCHTCGMDDDGIAGIYCTNCGQKLDWE